MFNLVAGQGDSEQDLATIKRDLELEFTLNIQFTTKKVGAGKLARQAVANDAKIIIVSSDDSKISAVTEALIGTEVILGVIAKGYSQRFC